MFFSFLSFLKALFSKGDKKGRHHNENTGATNLGLPQWPLVLRHPRDGLMLGLMIRAERIAAIDPCLVPHRAVESYTEASSRLMGDTVRINSPSHSGYRLKRTLAASRRWILSPPVVYAFQRQYYSCFWISMTLNTSMTALAITPATNISVSPAP